MSLDKAIRSGKEHRRPYYGSGRYDTSCRPHGGCTWCERNRMHRHARQAADDQPVGWFHRIGLDVDEVVTR